MGRAFLGEFEQRVMLAILRCDAQASPIEIRREVLRASGHEPSRGAFYTTLDTSMQRAWCGGRREPVARAVTAWPSAPSPSPPMAFVRCARRAERCSSSGEDSTRSWPSHDGIRDPGSAIRGTHATATCGVASHSDLAPWQTRREHPRRSSRGVSPDPGSRVPDPGKHLVLAPGAPTDTSLRHTARARS